jgi:putative flippase GtrA
VGHIPSGELMRFLGVGLWNTAFGYATFAAFTYLLDTRYPKYGYIAAGALSSVLNISVAFLGYKWFVFKTKGNYLREWTRCLAVYGSSIILGLILLPMLVFAIRDLTGMDEGAPYVAGAIIVCLNALYNFVGNKVFTFKRQTPGEGLR